MLQRTVQKGNGAADILLIGLRVGRAHAENLSAVQLSGQDLSVAGVGKLSGKAGSTFRGLHADRNVQPARLSQKQTGHSTDGTVYPAA